MYQIGDKVIYGNIGVCVVLDISQLDFIGRLPFMESKEYGNEKERKEAYRMAILSADLEQWASMIHFIYRKEQERLGKGQKVSSHYLEEMRGVERLMLGELAAALDTTMDEVKHEIANIENKESYNKKEDIS